MLALRELHLPAERLVTDVADAAFAVAIGLAAALVVGIVLNLLMRRRPPVRRAALAMLAQMSELPPAECTVAQARLLRRLVLTLNGEIAARRQRSAWLEQLDLTFRTDFFTRGGGRYYVDGLYQARQIPDAAALAHKLEELFRQIRR